MSSDVCVCCFYSLVLVWKLDSVLKVCVCCAGCAAPCSVYQQEQHPTKFLTPTIQSHFHTCRCDNSFPCGRYVCMGGRWEGTEGGKGKRKEGKKRKNEDALVCTRVRRRVRLGARQQQPSFCVSPFQKYLGWPPLLMYLKLHTTSYPFPTHPPLTGASSSVSTVARSTHSSYYQRERRRRKKRMEE